MTPEEFETLTLRVLFKDKLAQERLLPFLKSEVFDNFENKEIVEFVLKFHGKYDKFPTIPELKVVIKNKDVYNHLVTSIDKSIADEDLGEDFIKDEVEAFYRDKLLKNELFTTMEGIKTGDEGIKASASDRMREAYAFSFDTTIGLDFFESGEGLYESLHEKDKVIPTGLRNIDKIIKGGLHEKTLTLFMAETNMGKSLIKTALASNCLAQNKNVLYVTLEMAESKVAERIMANLFDIDMSGLGMVPKIRFLETFEKVKQRIKNKLVIKEYPTRSMNTNRLRTLLKELELKKNFVPDIIFVDYLGIMIPNHFNKGNNTNTEIKTISEELRGLGMERAIPIVSSVQTNRGGFSEASLDLTDIADSIGTTFTSDIIFAVTQSEELRSAGQFCFILLKNRYGLNKIKCMVGVDYSKMRLYEILDPEGGETDEGFGNGGGEGPKDTLPTLPNGVKKTGIVDDDVVKQLRGTLKDNKKADRSKLSQIKM